RFRAVDGLEVFNFAHFSLLRWRGVHRAGRAFRPAHARPTGTGAALSLPARWRFLLLSRLAARAGFGTQRQTFVRRCPTLESYWPSSGAPVAVNHPAGR